MSIVLADRTFAEGSQNMGGLIGVIYSIPATDIATFVEDEANPMEITAITCKTGKKFSTQYFTRGTGELILDDEGERDGASFMNGIKFFSPKLDASLIKLKSQLANGGFVHVVKDPQGTMFVVGTPDMPCYREKDKAGTGTDGKARAGGNFTMMSESPYPARIFSGSVPLTPAV